MHDLPDPDSGSLPDDVGENGPSDRPFGSLEQGIPSGIAPLDARIGGLVEGGLYLVAGAPGPAKLVATLQFLHGGLALGERCVLVTEAHAPDILEVARGWGLDMDDAWWDGRLEVIVFREDFEMRVLRSADPEDAVAELTSLVPPDTMRVAVDPGSAFFQGGARSLVGRTFLNWARNHPATVWATLVVGDGEGLPSSVEWLVNAAQGALVFGRGKDGVYEVHVRNARPVPAQDAAVTLQLVPGQGLVAPSGRLSRRRSDRREAFAGRVLLISSDDTPAGDLEKWVRGTFTTQVTSDPVTALQGPEGFESVLLFTSRRKVREALAVIREIRPVTASPIIVASDDAVRSMDRVDMLEAGADDCLTGGVDVRELAARMRQAVRRGGKSPSDSDRRSPQEQFTLGGLVEGADFDDELRRRAADPTLGVFGVIHVRASGTSLEELESVIADEIRADEGDLVKRDTDGVVVLLQGARGGASKAFLDRFRRRMQHHLGSDPGIEPDVFAHPADRERILAVLNGTGGR